MDEVEVGPPATGVRLAWSEVPGWLHEEVAELLGARVAEAVTQRGGFSPGVAARLRLTDGSRAFVKAVSAEANPDSPDIHRAEIRIASALPPEVPAPRLLGSVDRDGWVALLFEDIDGRMPAQPWDPAELDRVLDAVTRLAETLTPAPLAAPPTAERVGAGFHGWRTLLHASPDELGRVDPWARRHLAELAEAEETWADAVAGDTLAHGDLRADNLLLTGDRVYVVDWPWAGLAAPWFDLMAMLPSVRMQGGPAPETIFDAHPAARGADPAGVTAVLTALTGFFVRQSLLPPPPGLPTVRGFQAAQGRTSLSWLRTRWPE
ncbi:aminoglycoside phosphotransferase family protein [Actinocorallia longicatena]|uniref:Aminoglycoside phosphotransferase domain-containing protein n=1 Tax=Actinocorallia longicatena TaxID=111803 RepID=A0ABP6QB07_9ACTN